MVKGHIYRNENEDCIAPILKIFDVFVRLGIQHSKTGFLIFVLEEHKPTLAELNIRQIV